MNELVALRGSAEPIWNEVNLGSNLQTDLLWVRSHRWRAGQTWNGITLPGYMLWVMRRGVVEVTLDGQPSMISAGEAWLHPHAPRREIRVLQNASWLSLGFTATLYDNVDALEPLAPALWRPASTQPVEGWLQELANKEHSRSSAGSLIRDGLLRAIVGWCWESLDGDLYQLAQRELPSWLNAVLEAIHRRSEVGAHELAHISGYSPAQFRRLFHDALGCSPRDYLMRHRLEKARHQIIASDDPIYAVGIACGFRDPAQFSRYFKQAYGVAPLRMRQIARLQIP